MHVLWALCKSIRPYASEKIQFQLIVPFQFFMQFFSYLSLALSFENPSITAPESVIRTKIKSINKYLSQARRKREAGGHLAPPHFLVDQLTLSQPEGAYYPHPVIRAPPDFQTLRRPCLHIQSITTKSR